jgi:hypothetical protein
MWRGRVRARSEICPISRPDETGEADVDRVAERSVETHGGRTGDR